MEEINILKYHGNVGKQTVTGHFPDIMSANLNASAIYIIKTCQKSADGSFAGTGWTNDSRGGFFRDRKTYIFNTFLSV